MCRALQCLLASAVLASGSALAAKELVGIYGEWGTFTTDDGSRCYAVARGRSGKSDGSRSGGTMSVGVLRGQVAPQVRFRLPRARSTNRPAYLSVGGRRFELSGNARELFAPDARTDRSIIAAIRSARSLSISATGKDGAIVDAYRLKGAPSAIDAARLACL